MIAIHLAVPWHVFMLDNKSSVPYGYGVTVLPFRYTSPAVPLSLSLSGNSNTYAQCSMPNAHVVYMLTADYR